MFRIRCVKRVLVLLALAFSATIFADGNLVYSASGSSLYDCRDLVTLIPTSTFFEETQIERIIQFHSSELLSLQQGNKSEALLARLNELIPQKFFVKSVTYQQIKYALDLGEGFAVLTGFPIDNLSRDEVDLLYLAIANAFGTISMHTGKNKLIWDVTPSQDIGVRTDRTFSERIGEAAFHSDSSFMEHQEDYFSLLVVHPALDGGNSLVAPARHLVKTLKGSANGRELAQILQESAFPFAVHPAYLPVGHVDPAVIHRPVLVKNGMQDYFIRYRLDMMTKGWEIMGNPNSEHKFVEAVHEFDRHIDSVIDQTGIPLKKGDLLIAHNRRTVHARTDFSDPDRLVLRIRSFRR